MPALSWSGWQPLPLVPPVRDPAVLAELLDGGQTFRWWRQTPPTALPPPGDGGLSPAATPELWLGIWSGHIVQLQLHAGTVEWRTFAAAQNAVAPGLNRYFGLGSGLGDPADLLPWRSDPHLARCLAEFSGLRILRQPFGETLLAFLCSATKQIVQIKQMLALLAGRHGAPLVTPAGRKSLFPHAAPTALHRLPTWAELALVPESELRACLLGFRARYIHETARFLAAHPGWLDATELMPYAEAKTRLCSLPGVGEKVADCVLLFGAGRLEAFPVDVWILKAMAARYGLDAWRPAQVAHFGRMHFGPLAGLAQQFLFAYERRHGRR